MRVVFVNRFFYPDHSATSQLLTDLAFQCVEWKFDVTVITSRQRYDDPSIRLPESETVNGVKVLRVNATHFGRHSIPGRFLDYISFLHAVRKKLKRQVDDQTVVIAKTDPPMLGMFVGTVVSKRRGVMVNWLQDLFPETLVALRSDPLTRLCLAPLRRLRNTNLKKTGLNIVIGQRMRNYLLSEGISQRRLWVIRNWSYDAMDKESRPELNSSHVRLSWGLDGKFVVGYFGNLGRVHEYETILGAMKSLVSDASVVFLFVGGGSLFEKLKEEVARSRLRNVIFKNYVPRKDLLAALRAADVHLVVLRPNLDGFVLPSKFAGVVAAGRPVLYVGDPKGEIGQIVRRRKCGHVIEAGDSQELAGTIRDLKRDPETRAAMVEAAGQVYRKYYRREDLLRRWHVALNALGQRVNRNQ